MGMPSADLANAEEALADAKEGIIKTKDTATL
jgi:hypothetical protein